MNTVARIHLTPRQTREQCLAFADMLHRADPLAALLRAYATADLSCRFNVRASDIDAAEDAATAFADAAQEVHALLLDGIEAMKGGAE